MEIKIERNEFLKGVSRVQSIIERRSNMPILSTILIHANGSDIRLSATDLEIGFQQKIPAEVMKEGSITISGRKLFEILKESKGPIVTILEKENHWVYLSDGNARFNLACLPAEEYPVFVEPEEVVTVEIMGETLAEMINKTIYAVTMEEAGFKLSGVFMEKVLKEGSTLLRMVATDGHRLSMADKRIEGVKRLEIGNGVMIPKKALSELNKLASEGGILELGFRQNNCVARKKDTVLIIRLLESKFPDYHAVIPQKGNVSVGIKRTSLLEGMRKMLILSDERYRGVKITLENNILELVSTNPDLGEAQEALEVIYQGDSLVMGFNARYFMDVLQAMESEEVIVSFIDDTKPCVIKGEADQGFLGLIMPMRL
jgi:DNA polymerase III subunit beta